jgi:UDP-N-acetyl-D-glucosamine dehydrogenase
VLGLAYKANVDDMRESPAFHLMDQFQAGGAEVAYYDPLIQVIGPTREHGNWQGLKSVTWDQASIGSFDIVVICTAHASINYQELANWAGCIVDTRNAMKGIKTTPQQVWKA